MRLDLAAHPNAGVAHTNARVIFRRHPGEHFGEVGAGRDGSVKGESAAVRHGVAGVYAKIEQHLVDLAFVGSDEAKVGFQLEMEIDGLGKCRLQHALQVPDERVEIERRKTGFSLAG